MRVLKAARPGANIRRRGEDVRRGALILTRGLVLRGAEIAVLASMGIGAVSVVRRPRVAILSTGDELLTPGASREGAPPAPGKIYDSNAYGLAALVEEYGGAPVLSGIAEDTVPALTAKIAEAVAAADMVVTSAGVSRGDFDVVKEVLAREGEVRFWTVRMKPGKPLAFGPLHGPRRAARAAHRPARQPGLVVAGVRVVRAAGAAQDAGAAGAVAARGDGSGRRGDREHRTRVGSTRGRSWSARRTAAGTPA